MSRRTLCGTRWDRFERLLTCGIAHRNELGRDAEECPSRPKPSDTSQPTTPDAETGHLQRLFTVGVTFDYGLD